MELLETYFKFVLGVVDFTRELLQKAHVLFIEGGLEDLDDPVDGVVLGGEVALNEENLLVEGSLNFQAL